MENLPDGEPIVLHHLDKSSTLYGVRATLLNYEDYTDVVKKTTIRLAVVKIRETGEVRFMMPGNFEPVPPLERLAEVNVLTG